MMETMEKPFGDTPKQALFEEWLRIRPKASERTVDWCARCGGKQDTEVGGLTSDGYCVPCLEDMFNAELGVWDGVELAVESLFLGVHDNGGWPDEMIIRATCNALGRVLGPDALEAAAAALHNEAAATREVRAAQQRGR